MAYIQPAGGAPQIPEPGHDLDLQSAAAPQRSEGPHWDAFVERGAQAIVLALPILKQFDRYLAKVARREDISSPEAAEATGFVTRDQGGLGRLIAAADALSLTRSQGGAAPSSKPLNDHQRRSLVETLYGMDEIFLCNGSLLDSKAFQAFTRLHESSDCCLLSRPAASVVADALDMLRDLQQEYGRFVP